MEEPITLSKHWFNPIRTDQFEWYNLIAAATNRMEETFLAILSSVMQPISFSLKAGFDFDIGCSYEEPL